MDSYDLCVIGGGPGGLSAAVRAARRGASVCLVDPGPLGGTCLNRGCIPARTLGTTARLASQLRKADTFGLEVPQFHVQLSGVLARKERILRRLRTSLVQLLSRSKVIWLQGEGILQSVQDVEVRSQAHPAVGLHATSIILATGSRPSLLAGCPWNGKTVITSNEILDLQTLPASLLVIGAGVIGSEFASYFADLRTEVTLVDAAERVLPSLDQALSEAFSQTLRRRGVNILTNTKVKEVSEDSSGTVFVLMSDGHCANVSLVLVAVGRTPHLPKGLEHCGVKTEKGCVLVDDTLRTTVPSIFAIGDLLGEHQLACTASYEGALAAENSLGENKKVDYSVVPEPIYTEPEIATVGLSAAEAMSQGTQVTVSRLNLSGLARAQTLEETEGFVQVVADRATHRLLGVQIMGARATDLIGEAALAIKQKLSIEDLAETLHGHPTMSESIWETVSMALGRSIYYAENR